MCLVAIFSLPGMFPSRAVGEPRSSEAQLQLAQQPDDVHVRGYYRRNGTYVRPHWRSAPDGTPLNNYSFPGNVNPYTGQVAPGNPSAYLRNHGGSSAPRADSYIDPYGD